MTVNRTFGIGLELNEPEVSEKKKIQYINLKLAADGYPTCNTGIKTDLIEIAKPLLNNYNIKSRLLSNNTSPMGTRIREFLDSYLSDVPGDNSINWPENPFILDRYGLARIISIPPGADYHETDIIKTYRTAQGVLNNPKEDRRTTKGVFHVVEGGLPIPDDKKAVPKATFTKLLQAALNPPKDLMRLPFTANLEQPAELFVSLMLRPIVVPEVPGVIREKSMEVAFLAPGSLVSNLDFVESIFGNAGDPFLPENDAALAPENWTGHTGCVILATHLTQLTKKELGLPHYDNATERQRRDSMCWKSEDEKYNDGSAFKITCRDERGVVITIIADNYYGYCKKEVKTMISYSANLFGYAEEEHAGGAIAYRSYNLGEKCYLDERIPANGMNFASFIYQFADLIDLQPEGYAIDKNHSNVLYVPEDAVFDLSSQSISWKQGGEKKSIKLLPYKYYIYPNGYRIEMKKRLEGPKWHLTGTYAEGTLCHKPCTVSGGGKSEISKSIKDAMIQGSYIVGDLNEDLDMVEKIMAHDFSKRFKVPADYSVNKPRHILSPRRSLGSVIKLLTPSELYTDEYNDWLTSLPQRIKVLIYVIKGNFTEEWDADWRKFFSVDKINGTPGNELKFQSSKLLSNYLRVGHEEDGSWRIFLMRQDFNPSAKVQVEDDITASIVLSAAKLPKLNPEYKNPSVKIVKNCEARLFQRPDDCIIKGYDKQGEKDLSSPGTFTSNFQPLTRAEVQAIKDDAIGFELYTQPVKDIINNFLESDSPEYLVVPSEPRLVNGKPSKNPRYLQTRPDLVDPMEKYVGEITSRIFRKIPLDQPLYQPVNAVLPGRRNNPAEPENNVPPLAVYSPIHYQELPELFIDFMCSITGKSPSTTGFGSEGALTKGPFNNLLPSTDLNNAFLSYILTGYGGFSTAAGYVGPKYKVDHDVSLLIPEIWCRMSVEERDPKFLIENGYMEKVEDFDYKGRKVDASLLGYRITVKFVKNFMARIFSKPDAVFSEDMLRPELQDMEMFVASIDNLSITQKRVAEGLIKDGSVELLCPPLKALVHIMIDGTYKGKDRNDPEIREMFTPEAVLSSDWYKARLVEKQKRDVALWTKNVAYIEDILSRKNFAATAVRLDLPSKLALAKTKLESVSSPSYLDELKGSLGADPMKPIAD
ncbi:hypothetical protein [Mangrovibacterium diazotrophicum]|uniref:PPi-type phosphoenolpyruvate carboxykinase lobe 2 domain-containing protein n=1 Tax=Mangrovibacterium diazotrophicum TaxID=1261403 RepID=A0A419W716_9BACT|nr:hypothetical protein [Mangrovibacterium diazotrophicum]RKD91264.1 hypothetical protein BC643_1613 [Mangrovibacterium diazotrophicum]